MTLMRTGTLVTRAIALNSNTPANPLNGLTNKNLLLPIPLTEINLNKDAIPEQNRILKSRGVEIPIDRRTMAGCGFGSPAIL
jgi:hypothetical protein